MTATDSATVASPSITNGSPARPALQHLPPTPPPQVHETDPMSKQTPPRPQAESSPSSNKTLPGSAYPPYIMPSALPQPPFVDISGVANFRSLGGYLTKSGTHIIRPNLFYRCAHPMQITPQGVEQLTQTLGVRAIYDLRSGPEVTRTTAAITSAAITSHASNPNTSPSSLPPPVPSVSDPFKSIHQFNPVFAREDSSPEALAKRLSWYSSSQSASSTPAAATETNPDVPNDYSEGFVNAYQHIALHGAEAYTVMFRHILSRPTEPFVFHCTAGKDRTGVFAALLLRLAGVDDDTIAWEYSLTEPGLGQWRIAFIDRMAGDPSGAGMSRAEAARVAGSRAGNMYAFLKLVLDAEFGGVEKYMRDVCGLSEAEVQNIKENLLVGVDEAGGEKVVVRPSGIEGWTPEGGVEEGVVIR